MFSLEQGWNKRENVDMTGSFLLGGTTTPPNRNMEQEQKDIKHMDKVLTLFVESDTLLTITLEG